MMNTRKIICSGNYWVCENMDNLAPIIETGVQYLLSDGTTLNLKDGVCDDTFQLLCDLEWATKEEKKAFASQEYGTIFKGDKIIIKRGRKMLGETKEVKGYYKYVAPGTYGHRYTEYLLFTDGTKCNLQHCDVVGVTHKNCQYRGKCYIYRSYEEDLSASTFSVGGRL